MSERDLDARLDAVERALTDDETDLRASAEAAGDMADIESRLADLESRVDELEAGLQAVRGYAGNVQAVNREVERRASAALAKAETLEAAVEDDGPDPWPVQTTDRTERPRSQSRAADSGSQTGRTASVAGEPQNPVSGEARADGPSKPDRPGDDVRSGETDETLSREHTRKRSGADGDQRVNADSQRRADGDGGRRTGRGDGEVREDSGESSESQTEQFIERVRDAL